MADPDHLTELATHGNANMHAYEVTTNPFVNKGEATGMPTAGVKTKALNDRRERKPRRRGEISEYIADEHLAHVYFGKSQCLWISSHLIRVDFGHVGQASIPIATAAFPMCTTHLYGYTSPMFDSDRGIQYYARLRANSTICPSSRRE